MMELCEVSVWVVMVDILKLNVSVEVVIVRGGI